MKTHEQPRSPRTNSPGDNRLISFSVPLLLMPILSRRIAALQRDHPFLNITISMYLRALLVRDALEQRPGLFDCMNDSPSPQVQPAIQDDTAYEKTNSA
jgi:hypothetical protein